MSTSPTLEDVAHDGTSRMATEPSGRSEARPLRELIEVGAVVSAFAVVVAVRYLARGRLGAGFDRVAYTGPNHAVAFEAVRAGRLPQWNTYLFGGAPHLANPQVGAFYPLKYLVAWMPPQRGVTVLLALHLVILGVGMVVLLGGVLRLRRPATLLGGFAIVGCGVTISQLPHYEQLTTIAWVPWLLAAVEVLVRRRVRAAAGVGLVGAFVALMLLCGHQQPAYYALLLAAAWGLGRCLDLREWRRGLAVAIGVGGGFAVAAVQLLPTALLVSRSVRSGGLTLASVDVPEYTLDLPHLFGAIFGDPFSAFTPVGSEAYAATGAAVVFLGLVGIVASIRTRATRWHGIVVAGAAVGGVLLAMGADTPVYRLAFGLLPGLDLFRVPGRSIVVFDVVIAAMAAIGLQRVLDRRDATSPGIAAGVVAAFAAIGLLYPFAFPQPRAVLLWGLAGGAVIVASLLARTSPGRWAAAVVVAVPLLELGANAWQPAQQIPIPSTEATGEITEFLQDRGGRAVIAGIDDIGNQAYLRTSLRPNVNAIERVRSLDGYDGGPWLTRRWTEAMEELTGKPFAPDLTLKSQLPATIDPERFARFGVRWFGIDVRQTDAASSLPGWRGPVEEDGPLRLYENPAYRGEATVYRRAVRDDGRPLYEQVPDAKQAGAVLDRGSPRSCTADCEPVRATLRRPSPERLVVDLPGVDGELVVAEGWDPGWRAEVDGRSRRLDISDRNLLALPVQSGDRQVVLTYRAPGLLVGALVSASAILAIAVALAIPALRSRRQLAGRGSHSTT